MSLLGTSIHSRVMKVVKNRIANAQKEHDQFCKEEDTRCTQAKRNLEIERDEAKERKADELVKSIFQS